MANEIKVTPYCKKCGASVSIPEGVADDAILECKGCGERFGTVGDVKAKAGAEAQSALNKIAQPTFDAIKRMFNKS